MLIYGQVEILCSGARFIASSRFTCWVMLPHSNLTKQWRNDCPHPPLPCSACPSPSPRPFSVPSRPETNEGELFHPLRPAHIEGRRSLGGTRGGTVLGTQVANASVAGRPPVAACVPRPHEVVGPPIRGPSYASFYCIVFIVTRFTTHLPSNK